MDFGETMTLDLSYGLDGKHPSMAAPLFPGDIVDL